MKAYRCRGSETVSIINIGNRLLIWRSNLFTLTEQVVVKAGRDGEEEIMTLPEAETPIVWFWMWKFGDNSYKFSVNTTKFIYRKQIKF